MVDIGKNAVVGEHRRHAVPSRIIAASVNSPRSPRSRARSAMA